MGNKEHSRWMNISEFSRKQVIKKEEEKGKCRISLVRNSMKLPVSFLEKPKLYEITP